MEKIAFISGGTFIYWSSIILALAVVTAITLFAAMYLYKGGSVFSLSVAIPLWMVGCIMLSRLIHWYCRSDAYASLEVAMTDYMHGSYALMGTFIAAIVIAAVLRLIRVFRNLPEVYDCMAIAGGIGIGVGRLTALFNASDRGMALPDSVGLPFAYPVVNAVSGVVENRLATFMIQAIIVGVIVALLILYMLIMKIAKKKVKDGDVALMFLLAYGASQIICDSTRYDSLFLRSNGFISVVQILGLVALLVPLVVFAVRMVKRNGLRIYQFAIWLVIAGMMGLAGYMEYYVQRHGNEAAFAYSTMGASLLVIVMLSLVMRGLGNRANKEAAPALTTEE